MEALFSTASSADWNMYNENTNFGKRWYFLTELGSKKTYKKKECNLFAISCVK